MGIMGIIIYSLLCLFFSVGIKWVNGIIAANDYSLFGWRVEVILSAKK